VVDTDGNNIVSNEVINLDSRGETQWPYPLRSATRELLELHGFVAPAFVGTSR